MSPPATAALFLASLTLDLAAAFVLARTVDRIVHRFALPEGLLGVLTALAADSPEIASAVTALLRHQHDVGIGVVLGSNLFNLAGLLGLSALVAGQVSIGRHAMVVQGGVAMIVVLISAALVLGWLAPPAAVALLALVLAPYLVLTASRPGRWESAGKHHAGRRFLAMALHEEGQDSVRPTTARPATRTDLLGAVPALLAVVGTSVVLVISATTLGDRAGLPRPLLGTLVLAALTSLPNVVAGVRLAGHGRGTAVVSATMNSNTANLVVGLALPALVLGVGPVTQVVRVQLGWLLALSSVAVGLGLRDGLSRRAGGVIVVLYVAFVVVTVSAYA